MAIVHAGELSDRIGSRRSLMISMVVTMAGYLVVAFVARSFLTLLVGLTVAGAGLTLAGPAAKVLVADHVPPQRQGLAFGVHMSAIPLGPLLAGLTVPLVGPARHGWRWPFLGGAVLAGIGMLMLPRERATAPPATRAAKDPASGRFGHVRMGPLFVFAAAAMLASCSVVCRGRVLRGQQRERRNLREHGRAAALSGQRRSDHGAHRAGRARRPLPHKARSARSRCCSPRARPATR